MADSIHMVPEDAEPQIAQSEEAKPSYFVTGKRYQVYIHPLPIVGIYLGTLGVKDSEGHGSRFFLVFQDENNVLIHIHQGAILAYFELTEETLAKAKRQQMLAQMQAVQRPRQN